MNSCSRALVKCYLWPQGGSNTSGATAALQSLRSSEHLLLSEELRAVFIQKLCALILEGFSHFVLQTVKCRAVSDTPGRQDSDRT